MCQIASGSAPISMPQSTLAFSQTMHVLSAIGSDSDAGGTNLNRLNGVRQLLQDRYRTSRGLDPMSRYSQMLSTIVPRSHRFLDDGPLLRAQRRMRPE